jgi:hypothetical protein
MTTSSAAQMDPITQYMLAQLMQQGGGGGQYNSQPQMQGGQGQVSQAPRASVLSSLGGASGGIQKALIMQALKQRLQQQQQPPPVTGYGAAGEQMADQNIQNFGYPAEASS